MAGWARALRVNQRRYQTREISEYAVYYGTDQRRDSPPTYSPLPTVFSSSHLGSVTEVSGHLSFF